MSLRHERLSLLAYIEEHIIEGAEHIATMQRLVADGERQQFEWPTQSFYWQSS